MSSDSMPPVYASREYAQNYTYMPTPTNATHGPQPSLSMSTLHEHEGSESATLYDAPGAGPALSRTFSRTPSPTPSEFNALNGIKEPKSTKQTIIRYVVLALVIAVVVVISLEHEKIVKALSPVTNWLDAHRVVGPLIPIAILTVLSFPPLFGHEIVAMLVGVTWDLPEAFGVVAAGTLLGEIANFFTFKYLCTGRAQKYEKSKLSYALLAHVVRQGGFVIVLVIRYSAIPAHFATVVFSTVGISFWVFVGAAILSLPKPLVPVYVGYAMRPGKDTSLSTKIERGVVVVSVLITLAALAYIRKLQEAAKPQVIYERRKARQGKLLANAYAPAFSTPANV